MFGYKECKTVDMLDIYDVRNCFCSKNTVNTPDIFMHMYTCFDNRHACVLGKRGVDNDINIQLVDLDRTNAS